MSVTDTSSATSAPSAVTVKLMKSQSENDEKVIMKLINSTESSAPRAGYPTGQLLNVVG